MPIGLESEPEAALREAALAVLHANDLGGWTRPAPRLYPHQWSWDSAFIAIGLAHVDPDRALLELETLLDAQWADGRVPHIVFNPDAADYFPGADWWASASTSPLAPREPATSGLIQPPVHALALRRIQQAAAHAATATLTERIQTLYPKMLAWHRYLASARDPRGDGLLLIYHPWESGTDNSPRWDAALSRVQVGDLPAYQRHDLQHVADPSQRPTHAEYDRYLWLVELLKANGYDDRRIQASHPFMIGDVLTSAIFAAANQQLAEVGEALGRPAPETLELFNLARRFSSGVERAWDAPLALALDLDLRADGPVRVETCAGLASLLLPDVQPERLRDIVARLTGPAFAGAVGLLFPFVPSTAPGSPGFQARSYWRGPTWPVANWLLWWGLRRHGQPEAAASLRAANLDLLRLPSAQFAEYFDPYTGEPLGSLNQSWTAAVALDWLSE